MTEKKPILLDLYCCEGGAGSGYRQAGFYVIGVDIEPRRYKGDEFYRDDAFHTLDVLLRGGEWNGYTLADISVIHASPECKGYTGCNLSPKELYQKQIAPIRERLIAAGLPYIIENVMGAKSHMNASIMLCGSMFGLRTQRHRLFETNMPIFFPPAPCDHRNAPIAVYGHSVWDSSLPGTRRKDGRARPDSVSITIGREAMGIDWNIGINEMAEAIPPAYTKWLGEQALDYIREVGGAA